MSTRSDDFGLHSDEDVELDAVLLQRWPWLETPLSAGSNQIRILRLHKGRDDDPMTCNLLTASLDENPVYETLSYVWGDASRTKTILVGVAAFEATVNLFDFLHHLRLEDADRLIWADAVCIDQRSEEEKRHQMRLMTRIYLQGTRAHIWFGPFTTSWISEIPWDDEDSIPSSELKAEDWEYIDNLGQSELKSFIAAGGRAPDRDQYLGGRDTSLEGIFGEALHVLSATATGKKMHEFPLYVRDGDQYCVNRHWATIQDCIRWIITRPWWSRVWTYQEAILPSNDSLVHTMSRSFPLSMVLDGVSALSEETSILKRKIKYTALFWAVYQQFPDHYFDRARDLQQQRMAYLNKQENQGLSLESLVRTTQRRQATEIRDHFFGIFAVLPSTFQRWWLEMSETNCLETAAQIFARCTKEIFFARDKPSLEMLSAAIGVRQTRALGLPSWAIDLSAPLPDTEDKNHRWDLYDACSGAEPAPLTSVLQSLGPQLRVAGIPIATVRSTSQSSLGEDHDVLELGREWLAVYHADHPRVGDEAPDDGFWRTAFMDRDIWRHWLHDRKPLPESRLRAISAWWARFTATGDKHDLIADRIAGDGRHGSYHFRALLMNMTVQRFFMTTACEPGLGPHGLEPGDEVYVLKGYGSPVVLRRVVGRRVRDAGDGGVWKFVGSCFVDGWMYGEAVRRRGRGVVWKSLDLV